MHIPKPSLRRSSKDSEEQKLEKQKRKASDTSTASVDVQPARKKLTKAKPVTTDTSTQGLKRSISLRKPRKKTSASALFPDEEEPVSPRSQRTSAEQNQVEVLKRSDSLEPQTQTPRRSSRIKESISKCSEAWDRCRPYIERINGTFMPIDNKQGTKAYYHRDGIKL